MATKKKDLNLCIEINLLPAEFRRQKKDFSWILDRRVVWPVVATIVFVFCIFLLFAYMNDSRQTLQNALASTKAEIEKEDE